MGNNQKIKIKHKGWWIAALIAVFLVVIGYGAATVYLNYINIKEIGEQYLSIYIKNVQADIILKSGCFVLAFILFMISDLIIKKNLLKWEPTATYLTSPLGFWGMPALLALITICFTPYHTAESALIASNPSWFSVLDPIFFKDVGYYVFQRPLFMNATIWGIILLAFVFAYSVFVYFLYYVRNGGGGFSQILKQQRIVVHLTVCVLAIFALTTVAFSFAAEELLFTQSGDTTGGKYTDMTVWLNYYKLSPIFLFAIILAAIIFIVKKKPKHLIGSVLAYPAIWIVAVICAVVVQQFVVRPNEASMERPYIKNNIQYTNMAYNLDDITEIEYPVSGVVTPSAVAQNESDISNIRIADIDATLQAFNQLQSFRTFYTFSDIDTLPYTDENGNRKTALVSVRELNTENIPKDDSDYVSRTMRYTHGYGVTASSASAFTADGKPEFLIEDMDGTSKFPTEIKQNRIYFGELADDDSYVIVNTLQNELDYYNSKDEQEFSYDGYAGVQLNPFTRILYAAKYTDINIAISGYITNDSRILTNRNIIDRAKLALPFLTFDEDAHIAITDDGRLVWVIDGYTTTNNYPYSQRDDTLDEDFGTNYVRNSVKVIVDAYHGTVDAYVIDWNDPIIQTYNKTYPGVFSSEALPVDIASQITYPETLFEMQANIYKKYHNTNPSTFYSNSDLWEISKEKRGTSGDVKSIRPYYNIAKIYNNTSELVLMQPFTAVAKDNMTAWVAASCDINNYGKMTSYIFPQSKHVYGSLQIENKIDTNSDVSALLSTLKTDSTSALRGNMLVVPIMDTVVYIKPIYTTSTNTASVPELQKIVLVCGDNIIIENSVKEAFAKLAKNMPSAGYDSPQLTLPESPETDNELILSAIETYKEASQFQSEGDWINYGRSMKQFDDIMKKLETEFMDSALETEANSLAE